MADSDYALFIENQGEKIVSVRRDGTVEYGPGYDPDTAAINLWNAVAMYANQTLEFGACECPGCGHVFVTAPKEAPDGNP